MNESQLTAQPEQLAGSGLPIAVTRAFGDVRGRIDGDLLALHYLDDQTLASVEEGGVLRRWEVGSGRQLDVKPLSELETCWAFSPDGRLLVSGGNNFSIWDVESGSLLGQIQEPSWVLTLAFSPDGKLIASGHEDHSVAIWKTATGKRIHTFHCHQAEVCALAFNRDGTRLASAGEDRLLVLLDVGGGTVVQEIDGNTDRVDALSWSPEGNMIASAGWDTAVRLWDTTNGELLALLNGQGECVHTVAFLSEGDRLVCGDSDFSIRVWDHKQLKVLWEVHRHQGPVRHIAERSDGKQIATGGSDRSIMVWDMQAEKPSDEDPGPLTPVKGIDISSTGELVAVHTEGRISRWEISTGQPRPVSELDSMVVSIAISPAGWWAAGTLDGRIALWSDPSDPPVRCWQAHETPVRLLTFDPQGNELASSSGLYDAVRLWNAETGNQNFVISQATKDCTIEAIAYHPDGEKLAVAGIDWNDMASSDGLIALWDLKTRNLEQSMQGGASRIAISPDGKFLAAISPDQSVLVRDWPGGNVICELSGQDATTNAIAFDPKGRYLVSGSSDNGLRVWETRDWKLLATFDLETSIKDLAFDPTGNAVIVGNGNSTCYLVELDDSILSQ